LAGEAWPEVIEMLSRKIRIQLIVVLICLIGVHLFILPPNAEVAAEKKTLKEIDMLIDTHHYSEAIELINSTLKFHSEKNVDAFLSRLALAEKLDASEKAHTTAMKYYNEGDLTTALTYFKKVVPEDVKNFTNAREKICQLDLEIVQNAIDEKKAAEVQ